MSQRTVVTVREVVGAESVYTTAPGAGVTTAAIGVGATTFSSLTLQAAVSALSAHIARMMVIGLICEASIAASRTNATTPVTVPVDWERPPRPHQGHTTENGSDFRGGALQGEGSPPRQAAPARFGA